MPQNNCMGALEYKGCYINWKALENQCTIVWPNHTIKICASMRAAKLAISKAYRAGKIPEVRGKPIMLDDLPVIVTGPGRYTARNGWRVEILSIEGTSTFNCKGYFVKPTNNGKSVDCYNIWHVSGRFTASIGSPMDIISKHT